ncbi:CaiB/BaiF CoA transferase family protein [Streptomyces sp. C10-9-1]|uniref:CaiB/BaiF CoA transferase family protein n=1 Tax=Streptomyces sp. C10-9-1 TaxID=1859285 RepID=UPI003D70CB0B
MPENNAATPRPMDGLRVLDFTQNVAGPLAGQVMADLGAEVIKVEAPGGEAARRITSTAPGQEHLAPYFLPNNRGKKSITADLRTPEGKTQILALADTADVVLEAFRPGVMDRMGLGAQTVQARNPKCVYASLSAYGGRGPHGKRPGVDIMVQAESGLLTGLQAPDGQPLFIRSTLVDAASGHVLAQAVLAALLNRERHGVADVVSVAMYDVACSLQANNLTLQLNTDPTRRTSKTSGGRAPTATAPTGAYRAADGGYLVLSAYVPKHWKLLTELLGRPELADDPRYADQALRSVHGADLNAELRAVFATRGVDEWVELLQSAGLMACKVMTWPEVASSPLFTDNGLAVTVSDGERTETAVRTPARYAGFTPAATTPTPRLGEHNEKILKELV